MHTADDMREAAKEAGLRYVTDSMPGIRRRRFGKGFRYLAPDGKPIADEAELARIRGLAIPPAYRDVWICPLESGHLQATGIDARGRKQYRYHPDWRTVRDGTKFHHMADFGKALPAIRERVERDLALPGLPRERILAAVIRILDTSGMRIGNREYAKQNGSFGVTTLRKKHVDIAGSKIRFEYRGKRGIQQEAELRDRRLARILQRCEDLPGRRLFQYLGEDGQYHPVDSGDVNRYLKEITGKDFTAKDFRTWNACCKLAECLGAAECGAGKAERNRQLGEAVAQVARELGHTPNVCKKNYLYPALLEDWLEGGGAYASINRYKSFESWLLAFLNASGRRRSLPPPAQLRRPAPVVA